jgi:hypothetical protein
VLWLSALASGACFTDRVHDDTLDCSADGCHCVTERANCDGDWDNGCEIDLQTTASHCGECQYQCLNGSCVGGSCLCADPSLWDDCDGIRSNGCETWLRGDDSLNCGQCGNECGATAICQDGICTERCLNGVLCGDLCVDTSRDPENCGGCGNDCASNQVCFDGICQACQYVCGVCLQQDLGDTVPQHVAGVPTSNGLDSVCWSEPLPGSAYRFQAPAAGTYSFNTFGSVADSALSVRRDEKLLPCPELNCTDPAISATLVASVSLDMLQSVVIEVASLSGIEEATELHITADDDPLCEIETLGWATPILQTGDFANAADVLQPSCAPAGGLDVAAKLIVAESGYYLMDTDGSVADTVLYALTDTCSGAELGCDDDTNDQDAQLVLPLTAGHAVVVVVELRAGSPAGPYSLHIEGPL